MSAQTSLVFQRSSVFGGDVEWRKCRIPDIFIKSVAIHTARGQKSAIQTLEYPVHV